MAVEYTHKRGASFVLRLTMKESGSPVDLTGHVVQSMLYDRRRTFVYSLNVVVPVSTAGKFILSAPAADTATWPMGRLFGDVRITQPDGESVVSQSFEVEMVGDAAYDETPEDAYDSYGYVNEQTTESEDFGTI
jgi:hypothetical protein